MIMWHFATLDYASRNPRPLDLVPPLIQLFYLHVFKQVVWSMAISLPQGLTGKWLECARSEQDSCC